MRTEIVMAIETNETAAEANSLAAMEPTAENATKATESSWLALEATRKSGNEKAIHAAEIATWNAQQGNHENAAWEHEATTNELYWTYNQA